MRTKRSYKSIASLKNRVNNLNLYNLMSQSVYMDGVGFIKTNDLLTAELIDQVCELLGGRARTKKMMFHTIRRGGFSKWYLERIYYSFSRKCFTYCAGQDYSAEIISIRKDLTNRY